MPNAPENIPTGLRIESIAMSLINLFLSFLFCSLDKCLFYCIVKRFLENRKRSYLKLRKEMCAVRRNAPVNFPTGLRKESISLWLINLFSSFLFCSVDKCSFSCIVKRFLENRKRSYLKLERCLQFAVNWRTRLRKKSISQSFFSVISSIFVLLLR